MQRGGRNVHHVPVIITHVDNAMAAQCIVRRETPDCLRCGSIALISALRVDVIRVCLFLRLQFPTIEAVWHFAIVINELCRIKQSQN